MNVVSHDGRVDHALDIQAQLLEMRLSQLARCRYRVLILVTPEDDPQSVSVATNVTGATRGVVVSEMRERLAALVRLDLAGVARDA